MGHLLNPHRSRPQRLWAGDRCACPNEHIQSLLLSVSTQGVLMETLSPDLAKPDDLCSNGDRAYKIVLQFLKLTWRR
jgi:hypothetical protein